LGYQNFETPEPIVTKFGTSDNVGDMAPCAKIQTDSPINIMRYLVSSKYFFKYLAQNSLLVSCLELYSNADNGSWTSIAYFDNTSQFRCPAASKAGDGWRKLFVGNGAFWQELSILAIFTVCSVRPNPRK